MLRYYDEMGLLKPAKINPRTGYRFYSVDQIPALQKIILLRNMDFSVSSIIDTLNNWGNTSVIKKLVKKRIEIKKAIQRQQEKISKIETAIADLQNDTISIHYNVTIKSIPRYKILSLRKKIPDYFCEGNLWKELLQYVETHKIILSQPIKNVTIFHDEDTEKETLM